MSFEEEKKGEEQDFFIPDFSLIGKQSKLPKEEKKPQLPKEVKKEEKEEKKEVKKEAKEEEKKEAQPNEWILDTEYPDPSWFDDDDWEDFDDDLLFMMI